MADMHKGKIVSISGPTHAHVCVRMCVCVCVCVCVRVCGAKWAAATRATAAKASNETTSPPKIVVPLLRSTSALVPSSFTATDNCKKAFKRVKGQM